MQYTYFVPRNTIKLATRGDTSPEGVEMTLIQERKSTHHLGTRLGHTLVKMVLDATLYHRPQSFATELVALIGKHFLLEHTHL